MSEDSPSSPILPELDRNTVGEKESAVAKEMTVGEFKELSKMMLRDTLSDPDLLQGLQSLGININEKLAVYLSDVPTRFFENLGYSDLLVETYFAPVEAGALVPNSKSTSVLDVMDGLYQKGYRDYLVVQKEPPDRKRQRPDIKRVIDITDDAQYQIAMAQYDRDMEAWEGTARLARIRQLPKMQRDVIDVRAISVGFAKLAVESRTSNGWLDDQENQVTVLIAKAFDRLAEKAEKAGGWKDLFATEIETKAKHARALELMESKLESRSMPPKRTDLDPPVKSTTHIKALLAAENIVLVDASTRPEAGTRAAFYEVQDKQHPDLGGVKVFLRADEARIEAQNMQTVNEVVPGMVAKNRLLELSDGTGAIQMEPFPYAQRMEQFLPELATKLTPENLAQFVGYCDNLLQGCRKLSEQGINVMVGDRKLDDFWFRSDGPKLVPVIADHGILEKYATSDWEHVLALFQFEKSLAVMNVLLTAAERERIKAMNEPIGSLLEGIYKAQTPAWHLVISLMGSPQTEASELNRRCGDRLDELEKLFRTNM